jgi:hypothetical protein
MLMACVTRQFNKIDSSVEEKQFELRYPNHKLVYQDYLTEVHTDSNYKALYQCRIGAICKVGDTTFKVYDTTSGVFTSVKYIYLNGLTLNTKQVDSLQSLIISRYNSGESIEHLCHTYSMDGGAQHNCDLQWISIKSGLVKEFSDTVFMHQKGEIFEIDLEKKKWHYVVLKTESNILSRKVRTIKLYRKP